MTALLRSSPVFGEKTVTKELEGRLIQVKESEGHDRECQDLEGEV